MAAYLIRRLWQMVPTLAGVVLLVFFLFKTFGGDPAEILGGLNASAEQVYAIREQLGLNKPWWVQLGIFLKQVATFDWGRSWATNESVATLFATRTTRRATLRTPKAGRRECLLQRDRSSRRGRSRCGWSRAARRPSRST